MFANILIGNLCFYFIIKRTFYSRINRISIITYAFFWPWFPIQNLFVPLDVIDLGSGIQHRSGINKVVRCSDAVLDVTVIKLVEVALAPTLTFAHSRPMSFWNSFNTNEKNATTRRGCQEKYFDSFVVFRSRSNASKKIQ